MIIVENEEISRAKIAAGALMSHADDAGWSVVWPAMEKDIEFGQGVMLAIETSSGVRSMRTMKRFTEDQLADLYIWIIRQYHQYQHTVDPEHNEIHPTITIGENIFNWSYSILNLLKERGKPQAVEAIRRISRELPEQDWLKWTIIEAQDLARRETWTPLQPDYILQMARDQRTRLVESGDQLLDVIIESLKRLEEELQGETPAVIDLWNDAKKLYRPKDENRFSDYVKRHLNRDIGQRGIIVNREVEIRRGEGSTKDERTKGERTDIQVNAAVKCSDESSDIITVIVEAKGCWNQELKKAMKTQLIDRYLKDNRCRHGIYLVGWFYCDQWDNGDHRSRRSWLSADEAREKFEAQAAELSNQNTRIRAFVMNTALR